MDSGSYAVQSPETINEPSGSIATNELLGSISRQSPARASAVLSVATLRRSTSNHATPTRTMHLTEQEHRQKENALSQTHRITIEGLQQRPRSNQRNRTPRRNESPMDPNEFRRQTVVEAAERRRATIHPGAGSAVGSVAPMLIREKPSSTKMGPSHRKVRRWNNEHFDKLAFEVESSSRNAANALVQGKQYAHLYKDVFDPLEHKSMAMCRFLEDHNLDPLRDRFFEGELPGPTQPSSRTNSREPMSLSGEERLSLIDSRLRRVVAKACRNSYAASRVIKTFETFLVESFSAGETCVTDLADDWWQEVLLECPTVTERKVDNTIAAQFYFHPTNATAGFHRILLDAICQFHGLNPISKTLDISIGDNTQSRSLFVKGNPLSFGGGNVRLLDVLSQGSDETTVEFLGRKLDDSWTVV